MTNTGSAATATTNEYTNLGDCIREALAFGEYETAYTLLAELERRSEMANVREYSIDGDNLKDFLTDIEEGGGSGSGAYKITVKVFPTAGKVSFNVNDMGAGMPMGEVTRTIRV